MGKKVLVTSGAGIITRPYTSADYRDVINKKSVDSLKRYIANLECEGLTSDYKEKCYAYAKARLPIAIKEELAREKKRQKAKEDSMVLRGKKLAEKSANVERMKIRKENLKSLGNIKIRELILSEYEDVYKESLEKKTDEVRANKINKVKSALENIDFVKGEFKSPKYQFMPISLIYLKDKNVILFRGIANGVYCFIYPTKDNLCQIDVITNKTEKDDNYKWLKKSASNYKPVISGFLLDPTVSKFRFDYFKKIMSNYYLRYEERDSAGNEKVNIARK